MPKPLDRREFVSKSAAAAAVGIAAGQAGLARASANEKVVVGVMGLQRGRSLAVSFARMPNVEIKYVCDVDTNRIESGVKVIEDEKKPSPQGVTDFRRILDDNSVDALVCAAPNHWHGPATILACQAGKHVYVEKPCCHNPAEGEMMIEAARKHRRAVQVGTQRRSGGGFQAAVKALQDGAIGRVYLAKAAYNNVRGSIGTGKPGTPPDSLNYDLWQGPAPRAPYVDNRIHYNWHWFWQWGNGELGNNGVHTIDICRWGLNVDFPTRVTSSGGRYRYQDDQQTPDANTVCFEFADRKQIVWQGLSCHRGTDDFVAFFGENGSLHLDANGGYRILDERRKEVAEKSGLVRGDREHIANFLSAIRNDQPLKLNAEIEIGHASTLLCHLGNIAQRTTGSIQCGPKGRILDEDAMKLWRRDYEPGWAPKV
jgi:predicted dehydrogenase